MNIRWWCALCALAVSATMVSAAEREDEVPTALDGDDGDDETPLHTEESRNVHPRAYQQGGGYNALPSGFRPAAGGASLAELAGYTQQPQPQPQRQQQPQRQHHQQQQQRPAAQTEEEREESEEEREEPDRLAQLLQQSRFECSGKQTGYYADQELQCEVFHYCQDSVKHSWICPDGFTFHQVHLICMPPAQDNICQKSEKYHFVNEYLYRPVNAEEVERKPNLPLRYSERYYPAEVYHDDRADDDEEGDEQDPQQDERPHQRLTVRPQAVVAGGAAGGAGGAQVFRSAEEVNIPLLQRRPQRPYEFRF